MVNVVISKVASTKGLRRQSTQNRSASHEQPCGTTDSSSPSRHSRAKSKNSTGRWREADSNDQDPGKPAHLPRPKVLDPPVQASHDLVPIVKAPKLLSSPPGMNVPESAKHDTTWLDQVRTLQQRVVDSRYFSWSVAAYVQLLLMVVLGALFLSPTEKQEPMEITVSFSSTAVLEEEEAEVVIAPTVTTPEKETVPEPEPELEPIEPETTEPEQLPEETVARAKPNPSLPAAFEPSNEQVSAASTEGAGKQGPSLGEKKAAPPIVRSPPSRARIVGAFSAWTEPENPAPGQPYVIVIQVTLPERIKRYTSSDLSGVIMGADGYRKFIQGSRAEDLPIVDHTARIRVPVIGAERGRKDSIVIQSRVLRQRQLIALNYSEPWALGAP
jgi:hypothetical protein